MTIVVLTTLFFASCIAIVVGYYNTHMGLSLLPIHLIFEEIAVIKAAAFNTVLAPVNISAAFLTSRGAYGMYRLGIVAFSLTTPYLVIFAVLPGATQISDHLQLHIVPMAILLMAAQLGACHLLKDRAWRYGGRCIGT